MSCQCPIEDVSYPYGNLLGDIDDIMALFGVSGDGTSIENMNLTGEEKIDCSDDKIISYAPTLQKEENINDPSIEPTPIGPKDLVFVVGVSCDDISASICSNQELYNFLKPLMDEQVDDDTTNGGMKRRYRHANFEIPSLIDDNMTQEDEKKKPCTDPFKQSTTKHDSDLDTPLKKKARKSDEETTGLSLPSSSSSKDEMFCSDNTCIPSATAAAAAKGANTAETKKSGAKSNPLLIAGVPPSATDPAMRFRGYQNDLWLERFHDLQIFQQENGHCLVPHTYKIKSSLIQWVKRQRHQYKLKNEGCHSTLTDQRQHMLEQLGFVWDSHEAAWEERFRDLLTFKQQHGHTNVPTNFPENSALSIWVKCQRRQYKLKMDDSPTTKSHITQERIDRLEKVGFVWKPRQQINSKRNNTPH